jgi:hypothetical protein
MARPSFRLSRFARCRAPFRARAERSLAMARKSEDLRRCIRGFNEAANSSPKGYFRCLAPAEKRYNDGRSISTKSEHK